MKISEFFHKNDQKAEISNGSKLVKQLLIMAFYITAIYIFGKTAYLVMIGMRLASHILYPWG